MPSLSIATYSSTADINQALKSSLSAGARFVMLLDDTLAIDKESLNHIEDTCNKHPNKIIGCRHKLKEQSNRYQIPGLIWCDDSQSWAAYWYLDLTPSSTHNNTLHTTQLNCSGLIISASNWLTVGGFNCALTPQVAALDWCLRATAKGIHCLEDRQRNIIVSELSKPATLNEVFLISKLHKIPCSPTRLALRIAMGAFLQEWSRVEYWMDYGYIIPSYKRMLWYLINLWHASRRERLTQKLKATIHAYLSALKHKPNK